MLQLDFTPWKAQVYYYYILLSDRLKDATIRLNSEKGSNMLLLDFTDWKAQVYYN
jgi:hypothetical protein